MLKLLSRYLIICIMLISLVGYGRNSEEGAGELEKIQVDDVTVGYRIYGSGYPLVMITGFSGTMDLWDPVLVSMLSDHYMVIVFDNRGMDATTTGERVFTIEQFADDTAGLMEALGMERAHVLSWSMGTEIALELVLRYPEKVDKLILYAGDFQINACPPSPDVLAKLYDTSGTPEEQAERHLSLLFPEEWLSTHLNYVIDIFSGVTETSAPENIQRQAEAMDSWGGACDRLNLIETPTLLITGTEDILTPPQNSLMLLNGLPNAQLEEIEDGGHGVMYQYPEEFSNIVLDFLSSQD